MRTDSGGHLFLAINQSDREVIVRVASERTAVRLPAHTKANVSTGWGYFPEWRISVVDEKCLELRSVSVAGQNTVLTIDPSGSLNANQDRHGFEAASERWEEAPSSVTCPSP
jgi:hypothetical protein